MTFVNLGPESRVSAAPNLDEQHLIARLTLGDPNAAAALFEFHADALFSHARRISGSQHDADDIVSSTFLEMWRKRESIQGFRGTIRPWLLLTANNINANRQRSSRRLQRFLQRGLIEPDVPDHADAIVDSDAAESSLSSIATAFRSLSTLDQAIVTLCLVEELTYAQAAELLGLSHGSVRNRLSRARAHLANAAKESMHDKQ